MDLSEYQKEAFRATPPHDSLKDALSHWTLGLTEESGEVASLVKHQYYCGEIKGCEKFAEELGDVLWYVAAIAHELNLDLGVIAEINLAKLRNRFDNQDYFDPEKNANRHQKLEAFKETDEYKELISKVRKGA